MHFQHMPAPLTRPLLPDLAVGRSVVVVNAHGVLRALRVIRRFKLTVTLEDGCKYHWNHNKGVFLPDTVQAGQLYRLPSWADPDELNAEYVKWHAQFHQAEAERAVRVELATAVREVARRIALAPDIHTLTVPELQSVLNSMNVTAKMVAA